MAKRIRKDYKPSRFLTQYPQSVLRLSFTPTARLKRLKAKNKKFMSQRDGWMKFYLWQDRYGPRLELKAKLCSWD